MYSVGLPNLIEYNCVLFKYYVDADIIVEIISPVSRHNGHFILFEPEFKNYANEN